MNTPGSYLSESQIELVRCVLDRIVPPEGRMPGGGEAALEGVDRAAGAQRDYRTLWSNGLAQIEVAAWSRHGRPFVELSEEERDGVLTLVDAVEPRFLQSLVRETYVAYYSNPRVVELLGLEPRPPQPRGHHLEEGRLDGLEKVVQRGVIWRAAGG